MEDKLAMHKDYPVQEVDGGDSALHQSSVMVNVGTDGDGDLNKWGPHADYHKYKGHTDEREHEPEGAARVATAGQYAVEEHQRNTKQNPHKEDTYTTGILVRRINSAELLPRPFKSMNQFICFSYVSLLFCCLFGAFATEWAWKAKIQRNKGLYTAAKDSIWRSKAWAIAALAAGSLIITIVTLSVVLSRD